MLRLPAALERRLHTLFPRARDRERFVADLIEEALKKDEPDVTPPASVGGTLHLFTDGGARGNPGQAAIGCVLIDPRNEEILREYSECIGVQTNNIAEYRALIAGLSLAEEYHPNHLQCHLDSELVVRQLNGEYRVKMPTFQPLIEEIQERSSHFPSVTFVHVPRHENARADALVNRALDTLMSRR